MDLFVGKQLLTRSQEPVKDVEESLQGKIVGVYFSAGWCPPCRDFTPLLAEVYQELGERKLPFEVVFVSCDKRKENMLKYMEELHGDWLCLPFGDKFISELKEKFNIIAIPKLIILSQSGQIITVNGRKEVQDRGFVCFNNWQKVAEAS